MASYGAAEAEPEEAPRRELANPQREEGKGEGEGDHPALPLQQVRLEVPGADQHRKDHPVLQL